MYVESSAFADVGKNRLYIFMSHIALYICMPFHLSTLSIAMIQEKTAKCEANLATKHAEFVCRLRNVIFDVVLCFVLGEFFRRGQFCRFCQAELQRIRDEATELKACP